VSRERAARRAVRLAEAQTARVKRERAAARRDARRRLARRLAPRLPDRRTGRLFARRSRSERLTIVLIVVLLLGGVWWAFDGLATRIALTALVLVALPALIVLTLDRR
jgi:hypothetical protein